MTTIKRPSTGPLPIMAYSFLLVTLFLLEPGAVKAQWTTPDANQNINNTNTGNVGIGTTTPTALLEVKKSQSAGTTVIVDNPFTTSGNGAYSGFFLKQAGANRLLISSVNDNHGTLTPGTAQFWNFANGPIVLANNNTERMRISSDGRVGIGTTSPTGLLTLRVPAGDVIQAFSNAGGSAGELHIRYKYESALHRIGLSDSFGNWLFYSQYASPNTNSIGFFPGRVGIGISSPLYSLDVTGGVNGFRAKATTVSASDAVAAFENNNGIQFIVRGNGNVGIGTTSPGYKLHVQGGSINTSDGLCINGDCKTAWSQVGGSSQWANGGSGSINYGGGFVGIGTTNPSTKLDVAGTVDADAFTVNGSTVVSSQWATSGTTINYSSGNVGIATASPTEKLHVTGNVKVTGTVEGGNIIAKYQDVAEWVESSQELMPGTVVVLDSSKSNQVIAATQSYDSRVAGVISLQPGIALGERGEGRVLVATTGRVKVKVDATNGPIAIGDLLVTSDREGYAMKSLPVNIVGVRIHRPGTLIGKALEPLAQGTGEILVLLSLQ